MKTTVKEARLCSHCGRPMPPEALARSCPACLLAHGDDTDPNHLHDPARFLPPSLGAVARLFPHLEILGLLGAGGMGAVYKARQPVLDRIVALKLVPGKAISGARSTAQFNREARALARLNHPNVIALHEFGQVEDWLFFLMEFVDGANLRQLARTNRFSPVQAGQLLPQICDGLQFAHDAGVVHRDIKPENVLVDSKGRVKIADFGLARILGQPVDSLRLTREGQVMGTPHYMAPEQVEHPLMVDHRADIYSLGVVLYEMLTGDLPLGHFAPPSRTAKVDVRYDEIVLRALQNDPAQRFQRVSELKGLVETIANSPLTPALERPPPRALRTRAMALVAILFVAWLVFQFTWRNPWFGSVASRSGPRHVALPNPKAGTLLAALPGGASLELLALSDAEVPSNRWWRPDGTVVTDAIYQVRGPADMVVSNATKRFLAFKMAGLTEDLDTFVYDFKPAASISSGGSVLQDGRKLADGWPMRVAWPGPTRTALIRIGYSDRPWRTVVTHNPGSFTSTQSSEAGDPKWIASLNHLSDDGADTHLTIILGPKEANWKMRVVALDQAGRIRAHQKASGTPSEKSTTWTLSFSDLTKEQVKEFQVQVRPMSWVEFPNVALHPRRSRAAALLPVTLLCSAGGPGSSARSRPDDSSD